MGEVEKVVERWGLQWPGHNSTHERMDDGYWTPWHVANTLLTSEHARAERAEAQLAASETAVEETQFEVERWHKAWCKTEAQLAEAMAAERERCAKVAEELTLQVPDAFASIYGHANDIAAAIRALTESTEQ